MKNRIKEKPEAALTRVITALVLLIIIAGLVWVLIYVIRAAINLF